MRLVRVHPAADDTIAATICLRTGLTRPVPITTAFSFAKASISSGQRAIVSALFGRIPSVSSTAMNVCSC
jgi:hypothetical protein